MKVVVQRVRNASVSIGGTVTGAIGPGLLVLVGICEEDGGEDIDWLVKKITALRVFDDAEGVMNLSVKDVGGDVLVVSQMTLSIVLNMIQMSWRQYNQEKNIAEVYKTAEELMSQLKAWMSFFLESS